MQNTRQMGRYSVNHIHIYRYTAVEVRSLADGRQQGAMR